jgi:hypothetical protein
MMNDAREPACVPNLPTLLFVALDVESPFVVLAYREQALAVRHALTRRAASPAVRAGEGVGHSAAPRGPR